MRLRLALLAALALVWSSLAIQLGTDVHPLEEGFSFTDGDSQLSDGALKEAGARRNAIVEQEPPALKQAAPKQAAQPTKTRDQENALPPKLGEQLGGQLSLFSRVKARVKAKVKAKVQAKVGGCSCKGSAGYGEKCDPVEEFPWCYVPIMNTCSDAVEECDGGVCTFWSESACASPGKSATSQAEAQAVVNTQHEAMLAAKPQPVAPAGQKCTCKSGAGYGEKCDPLEEFPWCYVTQALACPDAVEECEGGTCQSWSEASCMPAPKLAAVIKATTTTEATTPAPAATPPASVAKCACKNGAGYGEKCDAAEEMPWCYVVSGTACSDAVEECEGSLCSHWSEAACQKPAATAAQATVAISAQHASQLAAPTHVHGEAQQNCGCQGGTGYGQKCDAAEEFPWCYVASGSICADAVDECEGNICQQWSEAACKEKGTAPVVVVAATPAPGVNPTSASCACDPKATAYGATCDPAEEFPWCYVPGATSCGDSIEECEAGKCRFWSESACKKKVTVTTASHTGTVGAQHTAMIAANPAAHTGTAAPGCTCKGGTSYGGKCDMSEEFPWCYAKEGKACKDGIEECEGGMCEFWSEVACTKGAAPAVVATKGAAPTAVVATKGAAPTCTCLGGAKTGGKCDMTEEFPWCYVKEKGQCNDGIEECEGGVCEFWSEKACKPGGTSGGAATVAVQHTAMIKANPTVHAGAVTPGCKCKPGTAEGLASSGTCTSAYPWCYVAGQGSCDDGIEECEGGVCQWWSDKACKAPGVAATAQPKHCACKGGTEPGNSCVSGSIDNFGMPWCYIAAKDVCADAVMGICESDHSCSFYSEAACAQPGTLLSQVQTPAKTVPMTLKAPAVQGGSCRCKGGAVPGNTCDHGAAATYGVAWCYILDENACSDAVLGICQSDHSCTYWSEIACNAPSFIDAAGANKPTPAEMLNPIVTQVSTATALSHYSKVDAAKALNFIAQNDFAQSNNFATKGELSAVLAQLHQQSASTAAKNTIADIQERVSQLVRAVELNIVPAPVPQYLPVPPPAPSPPQTQILMPQMVQGGIQGTIQPIVLNPSLPHTQYIPPAPPLNGAAKELLKNAVEGIGKSLGSLAQTVTGLAATNPAPAVATIAATAPALGPLTFATPGQVQQVQQGSSQGLATVAIIGGGDKPGTADGKGEIYTVPAPPPAAVPSVAMIKPKSTVGLPYPDSTSAALQNAKELLAQYSNVPVKEGIENAREVISAHNDMQLNLAKNQVDEHTDELKEHSDRMDVTNDKLKTMVSDINTLSAEVEEDTKKLQAQTEDTDAGIKGGP